MNVSIRDVMICWTSPDGLDSTTRGTVRLIKWPDTIDASRHFECTSGACLERIHKFTKQQREYFVMSTALGLIVNYSLDPAAVHRALWPLQEYRDALPPDTARPPENAVKRGV